jgi:hypothetical protein
MTATRLLAALGLASVCAGMGIAACSGTTPPETPDTGTSADASGEKDATTKDARENDAIVDASPDSGEFFPGEWVKVPGVPNNCELYYAKDPAVAAPPFPWKACASGRQDCKYFIGPWTFPTDRYFTPHPHLAMFEDERGVHLSYLRHTVRIGATREARSISVGQLVDGAGEFALRGRVSVPSCTPTQFHAGPSGYSASVFQAFDLDVSSPTVRMLVTADRAAPQTFKVFMLDGIVGPGIVQGVVAANGYSILNQFAGGRPSSPVLRHSDGAYLPNGNPPVGAANPAPVPGGYVAVLTDPPARLGFVPDGGFAKTLVRAPAGFHVNYVSVDRKNGFALTWYETNDDTNEVTLYTSPFATDESGIVKRPVAKIAEPYFGIANAGYFAYQVRDKAVRVLRLSDGLGWDIDAEPGVPLMAPLFVNEDYVWNMVSVGREDEPARLEGGLIRMRRPTTPPTIPSGL